VRVLGIPPPYGPPPDAVAVACVASPCVVVTIHAGVDFRSRLREVVGVLSGFLAARKESLALRKGL